jgi:hypothetical protein
MLNADTNIPSNRVPFFDQVTGLISREWYRYFLALLNANVDYAPQSDPANVPLTASPLIIGNDTQRPLDVMISNGGVIKVEFQRGTGGTKYNTGSYYGMFGLSPGDGLTITYSGTPIVTLIPR